MTKINLYVVYEDRELAKRDGAFSNPDLKLGNVKKIMKDVLKNIKEFILMLIMIKEIILKL